MYIYLLTDGNPHGHLILRGGREPNYGLSDITKAVKLMHDEGINHRLIIDCSMVIVVKWLNGKSLLLVKSLIIGKDAGICSWNYAGKLLQGGKQSDSLPREYGQSVTDECLSWQQTEQLLSTLAAQLNFNYSVSFFKGK